MIRWTDERVAEVIAYMAGGLRDGGQAARHFSEKWGVPLNSGTVRGALQRHRKAHTGWDGLSPAMELDPQAAEGLHVGQLRQPIVTSSGGLVSPFVADLGAPSIVTGAWVTPDDVDRRCGQHRAPEVKPEHIPAAAEKPQKILLVPDTHAPYQDKRAWSCMMRAARVLQPDIIVHLGDLVDCYTISKYPKTMVRRVSFKEEIAEANRCLDDLDTLGAKRKVFCEGNHCHRLARYITEKCPELADTMPTMREHLKCEQRGWEFYKYATHAQIGSLFVTHEIGFAGKYAAHHGRSAFNGNVAMGHTHRLSAHWEGDAVGDSRVGVTFGWLGDKEQIDYAHRVTANAWQLGFGIGYLESNGTVHLQPVPIIDYKCVVEGRLYEVAA